MGLRSGIDGATDLWNPQLDAVVGEDGEGEAELVAIEGPLRLTDHDAVEAAIGVGQRVKEASTLRAPLPRQGPRRSQVEELIDDGAVGGLDQLPRSAELPPTGRIRVLLVFGGHATVERESLHAASVFAPFAADSTTIAAKRSRVKSGTS